MALNFLGLGFNFGAKDTGLRAKQKEVASGFAGISDQLERLGRRTEGSDLGRVIGGGFGLIGDAVQKLNSILRINRLQTFIQSISLARLNDIADGVESIATSGMNLTTSFEATITAAHKSAKAAGANFGLTGKALARFTSKASSMGIALNISTEDAAKATYQYSLAVQELGAVGIKSASDLAKFSTVTGVSADMLVQTVRQARKQFGFTDEQLQQLTGSFVAAGQSMGNVQESLNEMPKIMDLISRRAAVMGKKLSPAQMAEFAGQTAAVTAGFYQMGVGAEQAREMALALATQMVESGEKFSNMFAGTESDLSDFHLALGIATGDIQTSFQTMTQGPGEFMAGMASMVLKSKKAGKFTADSMNLLRGQLSKVFGPQQSAMMVQFFGSANEAQLEQMKTMSQARKDLGKLGREGFSTGRTLAESFDMMKDNFVMNFRAIGRSAARDFVKETGAEFKKFNKEMSALVKKGGPMGKFVEKLSEIHQIGALALIPDTLRPMAAVFGTMTAEMTPFIGMLGSMGFRLSMLMSPFTMLLGALVAAGGWFFKLRREGKSTGEALSFMGSKLGDMAKRLWSGVKEGFSDLWDFLSRVDWGAVFNRIVSALGTAVRAIGDLLQRIPWGQIFEGVVKGMVTVLEGAVDMLVRAFKAAPDAIHSFLNKAGDVARQVLPRVVVAILDAIEFILKTAFSLVVKFVQSLPDIVAGIGKILSGLVDFLVKSILGIFDGIENWLVKKFPQAANVIHVVFAALKAIIYAVGQVVKFVIKVIVEAFKILWAVVGGILKALWWAFDTFVITPLKFMASLVSDYVIPAFKAVVDAIAWVIDKIADGISAVADFLGGIASAVSDFFGSGGVQGSVKKSIKQVEDEAKKGREAAAKAMAEVSEAAAAEAARIAKLQAESEARMAVASEEHKKRLNDIKLTYTTVQVTAKNAAEMAKAASDAAAQGIKNNIALVDAQVRKASQLAMPKMEESLMQAVTDYSRLQAEFATARGEKLNEIVKQMDELRAKTVEVHGVSANWLNDMRNLQLRQFTMTETLQKKLGTAEQQQYQKRLDAVFARYLRERVEIQKTWEAGHTVHRAEMERINSLMRVEIMAAQGNAEKIMEIKERFQKLEFAQKERWAAEVAKIDQAGLILHNKFTAEKLIMEQFLGRTREELAQSLLDKTWKTEQERLGLLSAMHQEFAAKVVEIGKGIPETMKSAVDQATSELNRWFFNEMQVISQIADPTERKRAIDELEAHRKTKLDEFTELVNTQNQLLAASNGATLRDMEDSFGKFTEGLEAKSKESALKAGAAVGTVQKELGVTAAEAMQGLRDIARIDPKEFQANLKKIKGIYIDFVKGFLEAFKKIVTESKKFASEETKIWNDLTDSLVKKFGETWMKILGFTETALAAIESDTARALANLSRIEAAMRSAASAQTQVAGGDISQQAVVDASKTEMQNLFQATHHPDWYEKDFKFKAMEIIAAINGLATALKTGVGRGGQTAPAASRGAARTIAGGVGVGVGSSRVKQRANLTPGGGN